MDRLLVAWVELVLRHRVTVLILMALLCAMSIVPLSQATLGSSMAEMFFGPDHPGYKRQVALAEQFQSSEVIIIAVEGVDPLSTETLDRLDRIGAKVAEIPDIARFETVSTLQRVVSTDAALEVQDIAKAARASPEHADALAQQLAKDSVYGGLFVSADARNIVAVAELTSDQGRAAERGAELVAILMGHFEAEGFDPAKLHRAGVPATMAEILAQSIINLSRLFPLMIVLLLGTVFVMFGRLWPVLVTSAGAGVSVLWTVGLSALLDPQINIMVTAIPGVLMIISFSDIIHICSAYVLELSAGRSREEAIVASAADVGAACALTSATTFVGFISLVLVPTPIFQHFGVIMAVGIVLAFGLAVTLVPILFSYMPAPPAFHKGRSGIVQRGLDRILDATSELTRRHPWPIIALFVVWTGVAIWGALQIEMEADMTDRLDPANSLRVDQRFFETHFDGTTAINLYLEVPQTEGLIKADVFNAIAGLEADIEALPEVDKVTSLVDLMRGAWTALLGPTLAAEKSFLPQTDRGAAQLMVLVEMRRLEDLRPFVDHGRRKMRMTLYTKEQGVRAHAALGQKVREMADARLASLGVESESAGILYLTGVWIDELFEGQRRGLTLSLILVAFLMVIGLRSLRAGLLSMIPNVLPLLAVAGYVGLAWDKVDTDAFMIAIIAIGIGVDDTAHFLTRLRLEQMRTDDIDEAIARTFRFAGRGIAITTAILALGFWPLSLSDYGSLRLFGTLLVAVLIVALVADLLWLPALARVGAIGFTRSEPK